MKLADLGSAEGKHTPLLLRAGRSMVSQVDLQGFMRVSFRGV